jgi:hypothetical protein
MYNVSVGKPEEKRLFGNLGGRKILKQVLKKQDVRVWAGFIWIKIGTSGGLS